MLINRLNEFKNALDRYKNLSPCDQALYEKINAREFELAQEELQEADIHWLLDCFKERWQAIFDQKGDDFIDYTFDGSGINSEWINLAKDLAAELNKPFLQILIPMLNGNDPQTFDRLSSITDPLLILIADDNQSWFSVNGIYERTQRPNLPGFFILNSVKPLSQARPLTLVELNRLCQKKDIHINYPTEKTNYNGIKNYLLFKILPQLAKLHLPLPGHLLFLLHDILTVYFNSKNIDELEKKVRDLIPILKEFSLEEVNAFYAVAFKIKNQTVYLLEILLNCLNKNIDVLEGQLVIVAEWLAQNNKSLIVKANKIEPELEQKYQQLHVGAYFGILQLKEKLRALQNTCSTSIKTMLIQLLTTIEDYTCIEPFIIQSLQKIYAAHWQHIKDKNDDYFRPSSELTRRPWLDLAEALAGAGWLESTNYYRFLIYPDLQQDIETVTTYPVTAYPLDQYILADNGELIHLPSSYSWAKTSGLFVNSNNQKVLSATEIARLKAAEKKYIDCFNTLENLIEPALSKVTIDKLKELIDNSLYVHGLQRGQVYSVEELKNAEFAYQEFYDYLHASENELELKKFEKQTIIVDGQKLKVKDVFDEAITETVCAAVCSFRLAKLVIDYNPKVAFRKPIEEKVKEMRDTSERKVFCEYDKIDQYEAIRRIQTLFVSLLTTKFKYSINSSYSVKYWDCNNKVTETGKKIFDEISSFIEKDNLIHSRHCYAVLMESIIKPAQSDEKPQRYEETQIWLNNIVNGTLFQPEKNNCFDPKTLFVFFRKNLQKKSPSVDDLLNNIIKTLQQEQRSFKKSIRINIKFTKFLNGLNNFELKNKILCALRKYESIPNEEDFINEVANHLIEQLANDVAEQSKKMRYSIFATPPRQKNEAKQAEITARLSEKLTSVVNSSNLTLKGLFSQMYKITSTFNRAEMETMKNRLNRLTEMIPEDSLNDLVSTYS